MPNNPKRFPISTECVAFKWRAKWREGERERKRERESDGMIDKDLDSKWKEPGKKEIRKWSGKSESDSRSETDDSKLTTDDHSSPKLGKSWLKRWSPESSWRESDTHQTERNDQVRMKQTDSNEMIRKKGCTTENGRWTIRLTMLWVDTKRKKSPNCNRAKPWG